VIQLVCLTIAPALISAPVYLSLGRIVKAYGTPFSLLVPRTYAIIFVCFDLVSLVLQALGGALAATGKTQHRVDLGVHILVAGLAFQVLSLFVFMALAAHLWSRVRKGGCPTNRRFDALRHFRGFRFSSGVCVTTHFSPLAFVCSTDMTRSYRHCDHNDPDQVHIPCSGTRRWFPL
jgi:hypothetical protein